MGIATTLISLIDSLYVGIFRRVVTREIFGYAMCGSVNMVLDAVWYYIIYHYIVAERFINLEIVVMSPHIASLAVVFPITFFTGFWLNRHVAFRATQYSSRRQLARYAFTVVGSVALNYMCMKLFVEHLHIWATPSKMLTTCVSVVYSFLAAKFYTFRNR